MQIPRRKSEELRRKVEGPIDITEEGFNQLKEKLAHLKRVMPDYAKETQQAAALGDRSDNAQYREAKSRLTRTHFQIFTLQDQIKRAVVIKPGKNISGKVQLGSTVKLETEGPEYSRGTECPEYSRGTKGPEYSRGTECPEYSRGTECPEYSRGTECPEHSIGGIDGTKKTFQILGAHETNPTLGKISFQSPLGAALMNHKKGDVVTMETPNGPKKYTIIKID